MPVPALGPAARKVRSKIATTRRYRPGADVTELRRELNATRLGDHIADEIREVENIDAWAERVAAALPPLTPDEAAAVGRLAAALDARRRSTPDGAGDAT